MVGKAADVLVRIKGDHKNLDGAVNSSKGKLGGLKAAAVAAGPAIAAAGVVAAAGFIAAAVKMAAEEEAVTATTATLLKKQGVMWSEVGAETDAYLKKLERLTTFNDTDLQLAFNAMLATGTEYNTAMESMATVTGLAAATGMDLETAGKMVGRALQGDVSILKRYGIEATATKDVMQVMNERFGDGSQQADTFEGQMRNLKNQLSNVMEAIGVELLPVATDLMSVLADGAMFILPSAVKGFKLLLIPIKLIVHEFKMTHMILKAVWRSLKGDFAGAKEIIKDMGEEQLEFNRELLNTAKDILGIKYEQESLNQEYAMQALLLGDVADEQANVNQAITEGAQTAKAASKSFDEIWKAEGGWISSTGKYISAREMGASGATPSGGDSSRSTAWDEPSHAQRPEHLWGTPPKVPTVKSLAATPPSISQTVNIGTVNESSAGNVADAIDKALRKAVTLNPW